MPTWRWLRERTSTEITEEMANDTLDAEDAVQAQQDARARFEAERAR